MQHHHFTDFDITIRDSSDPAAIYSVNAAYRERTAEGNFEQDITQSYWQQMIQIVGDLSNSPGKSTLMEIGSQLYFGLIKDSIRDLWIRARSDLEANRIAGIRLRLALQPPAVASLPWESLYDPDRNEAFAANVRTLLSRYENLDRHLEYIPTSPMQLPLNILFVSPEDPYAEIDSVGEIDQIRSVLNQVDTIKIQTETLSGRIGIIELGKVLEHQKPDILHIIGHGQPEGLLFWQDDNPLYVAPESLRVILQRASNLKLVVLNACLAGQSSDHTPFSTVGPQLLQAGIPAVVAMQYEIPDTIAATFGGYLYEKLVSSAHMGAIDMAMGYARSNLYALNPDAFHYGIPVLWLNQKDGYLFQIDDKAAAVNVQDADVSIANLSEVHKESTAHSLNDQPNGQMVDEQEIKERQHTVAAVQTWLQKQHKVELSAVPVAQHDLARIWNQGIEELQLLFLQLEKQTGTNYIEKAEAIEEAQAKIVELELFMHPFIE